MRRRTVRAFTAFDPSFTTGPGAIALLFFGTAVRARTDPTLLQVRTNRVGATNTGKHSSSASPSFEVPPLTLSARQWLERMRKGFPERRVTAEDDRVPLSADAFSRCSMQMPQPSSSP